MSLVDTVRRYWRALKAGALKPVHPSSPATLLPDDLEIHRLSNSGLSVVDNFCSAAEAEEIIAAAKNRLIRSGIVAEDGKVRDSSERISDTAQLFGRKYQHPTVLPLMQRAGALVGLPYTHLENVFVTRYGEGGFYGQHIDFGDLFTVDRLYTVLLYLNSMPEEQGGATVFPSLHAAVQPKLGRAVSWTNKNPDGSGHLETNHAAFPVKNGGEKWVIQFWFRRYRLMEPLNRAYEQSAESVKPLIGNEQLPEGVRTLASESASD